MLKFDIITISSRKIKRGMFITFLFISLLANSHVFADTILLKSGTKFDATVIERNDHGVVVDFNGNRFTYREDEIESIQPLDSASSKKVSECEKAYRSNQFERTLDLCHKLIESEPNNASAYSLMGGALDNLNKPEEAVTYYQKAVDIDSNNATRYLDLGAALDRLMKYEKYDEAITNYKKAIELQPNFFEAYNNLGNVLAAQENFEEALLNYKKAIELSSKPTLGFGGGYTAYIGLAGMLLQLNRIEEALSYCQKAETIYPNEPIVMNMLGYVLLNLNRFEESISYYKQVEGLVGLSNHNQAIQNNLLSESFYGLGYALFQLAAKTNNESLLREAIDPFKKSIGLNPKDVGSYGHLAGIYQALGDIEQTEYYLKKAIEL
ncbi:MAG: tetratricopeptide repeat protein, partial [Candidatus Omnitrophota bacterium]|nr:tetratricopeptide repeat protein [Candidatus Omnitrophota bacterium]